MSPDRAALVIVMAVLVCIVIWYTFFDDDAFHP